jgi:hypothetical protein
MTLSSENQKVKKRIELDCITKVRAVQYGGRMRERALLTPVTWSVSLYYYWNQLLVVLNKLLHFWGASRAT